MLHRFLAVVTGVALVPTLHACSDNPRDWVPLITALGRAAPVIASAAPKVVDAVQRLQPSPTPTPRPIGVRAVIRDVSIKRGDFKDLMPYLRTLDGDIPTLDELGWEVSNRSVVTLNAKEGRVQGASKGEAVVYAFLKRDPKVKAGITVSVLDTVLVREVMVTPPALTLAVGESRKVKAAVRMMSGEVNGNVGWSSSDSTIATVNPTNGEVTALAEGWVTIVATYAADTRYKGLLDLRVVAPGGEGASPAPTPAPSEPPTQDARGQEPPPQPDADGFVN
ncbi:MAG: Ig-like domain-containing protein [Candidatus Sericytochromatia bacterium]|nr:Ig-like domain-containing protein [Candidatus Sericytochromatia bacterium]